MKAVRRDNTLNSRLYIIDIAGPTKFARFRPSHGETDPRIEENSEDFFIQNQTARYQAIGYGTDARSLAVADFLRIRPIREEMDKKSLADEVNRFDGQPEYVMEVDPIDGQRHLFSEEYQEFLYEMIDNHRKYLDKVGRLHEFDEAEASAIKDMDRILSSGEANSAFYMVSDKSGTVRYANKFFRNGNGLITAQYLDVGKFMRDLTPEEALDVVAAIGEKHGFEVKTNAFGYKYLVANDKSLSAQQIHEAVLNKLIEVDGVANVKKNLALWEERQQQHHDAIAKTSLAADTIQAVGRTTGDIRTSIISDIRDTFAPIGVLLAAELYHRRKRKEADEPEVEKTKKEPGEKPKIVDRLKRLFSKTQSKDAKREDMPKKNNFVRKPTVVLFENQPNIQPRKKVDKHERKAGTFRKRMALAAILMPVAGEFGLAGSVLKLAAESRKPKKRKINHVGSRLNKHEKIDNTVRTKEKHETQGRKRNLSVRKRNQKMFISSIPRLEVTFKSSKRRKERRRKKYLAQAGGISQEKKFLSESRKHERREQSGLSRKKARQLVKVIFLLVSRLQKVNKPEREKTVRLEKVEQPQLALRSETVRKTPVRERKMQVRQQITFFTFAFVVCLIEQKPMIAVLTSRPIKKNNNSNKLIFEKNIQITEDLIHQTLRPWILLAIIWYLAMIREQGMIHGFTNYGLRKKNKDKRKVKKSSVKTNLSRVLSFKPIAQQGVIYAAHP